MREIKINVRERVPEIVGSNEVIAYNSDYLIEFDFDEEWDTYDHKMVYFTDECGNYKEAITTNDICTVPILTNSRRRIYIGVQAGNLRTTAVCYVNIVDSIGDYIKQPTDPPSQEVLLQVLEVLNNLSADVIHSPAQGEVGQVLAVAEVNEAGKPVAWETKDVLYGLALLDVDYKTGEVFLTRTDDMINELDMEIIDETGELEAIIL